MQGIIIEQKGEQREPNREILNPQSMRDCPILKEIKEKPNHRTSILMKNLRMKNKGDIPTSRTALRSNLLEKK
jgi:hypothetical protein